GHQVFSGAGSGPGPEPRRRVGARRRFARIRDRGETDSAWRVTPDPPAVRAEPCSLGDRRAQGRTPMIVSTPTRSFELAAPAQTAPSARGRALREWAIDALC